MVQETTFPLVTKLYEFGQGIAAVRTLLHNSKNYQTVNPGGLNVGGKEGVGVYHSIRGATVIIYAYDSTLFSVNVSHTDESQCAVELVGLTEVIGWKEAQQN